MSRAFAALLLLPLLSACGGGSSGPTERVVILATTTSTQDSGLLDAIIPAFEKSTGYEVKPIAVGSGQALALGARGEADVVLAHSPVAEVDVMSSGKAGSRRLVMHNDYVLLGPPSDPAGAGASSTMREALTRIAARQALFLSRGDDSGTHKLELSLWQEAGLDPVGSWYQESGQGIGATIAVAAEKHAYVLSDRATHLATADTSGLALLLEGDPALLNLYHVIDLTRRAGARVNEAGAKAFAEWLVSGEAQELVGSFGVAEFGRPLFVPDAGKTVEEVKAAVDGGGA